jgi:hypothetical protein
MGPAAALALLCAVLFSGCAAAGENSIFARVRQGELAEALDTQAIPALEAGLVNYWYPRRAATVVIAVDRERTGADIGGWRDLADAGEAVSFSAASDSAGTHLAAIAYGLEGEHFTLRGAAKLLAGLREKGLLAFGSSGAPVVICYDTQAPQGNEPLGSYEIVVPEEGTLTYVQGLLSNRPLEPEGGADLTATYPNASFVTDYGHLNMVCRDATRVLRREVLRTHLYSSADARGHQLAVLLYMVLVVAWAASVVRRAMQEGVRRASLLIGGLLLGGAMVRLLKYQLPGGAPDRYCWYGFYLFLLALPLVFLWLAWVIDQPEGKAKPPKWFAVPAAAGAALAALVLTNDLHNWAFRLDLSNPRWDAEYGYGPVYVAAVAYIALLTLATAAAMLYKGRRGLRKGRFLLPIGLCALLLAYCLAYAARVPLARESDMTMVVGLVVLLSMETAIRAGMIPVNSKYAALFRHSTLAMQIVDGDGNVVLSSDAGPLPGGEDTLPRAAPIAGGRALWREDIAALNRLHREAEEAVRKLTAANAMLAEEERVKRAVEEEGARAQLLSQLEAEIAGAAARLSGMIDGRESAARIALLVCYIKRRCNLFFRARETRLLPAGELAGYIDELAELAGYAGLRVVLASRIQTPVGLRRAALLYDVFYSALDWAVTGVRGQDTGERHMLASLGRAGGTVAMRLQCPAGARPFRAEGSLAAAVASAGGAMEVKDLEDAVGVNLSFPGDGEGGGAGG